MTVTSKFRRPGAPRSLAGPKILEIPKTSVRYHSPRYRCVRVKSGERFAQRATPLLSPSLTHPLAPRQKCIAAEVFFLLRICFLLAVRHRTRNIRDGHSNFSLLMRTLHVRCNKKRQGERWFLSRIFPEIALDISKGS